MSYLDLALELFVMVCVVAWVGFWVWYIYDTVFNSEVEEDEE